MNLLSKTKGPPTPPSHSIEYLGRDYRAYRVLSHFLATATLRGSERVSTHLRASKATKRMPTPVSCCRDNSLSGKTISGKSGSFNSCLYLENDVCVCVCEGAVIEAPYIPCACSDVPTHGTHLSLRRASCSQALFALRLKDVTLLHSDSPWASFESLSLASLVF